MLGVVLLVVTVAVVRLASGGVTYLAGLRARSVTWGLVTATMVVGPATLSRLTADLTLATALTGALAAVVLAAIWRRGPRTPAPPRPQFRLPWWSLVLGALMTAFAMWSALEGYFWDEHSCHYGLVTTLSRGMVPPEHPLFPGEPLRYHYGFDVIAAELVALGGLPLALAIDVTSGLCFVLLLAASRDLGEALGGPRAAALAVPLVPLGSGALQYFLFGDMGPIELHWSALPQAWANLQPPPAISNFFQHPQGLGMPLSLVTLRVFTPRAEARLGRLRVWLGGALLAALSLAQIVFFAMLGLALGAAALFGATRHRRPLRLLEELAVLASALGAAWLLGGFFADGAAGESLLLFGKSLFTDPIPQRILRYFVYFGVPLAALPLATWRARKRWTRLRIALLVAAWVGLLLPNFVTYARSWDIVKFLGVGIFFAHLLFADVLAGWWARAPGRRAIVVGLLVLASTSTGWLWFVRMSALHGRLGVPAMHFPAPPENFVQAGAKLAPALAVRERVYATHFLFGHVTGLLTPGFVWQQVGQGFMLDRKNAERLVPHKREAARSLRDADLDALEVRFLVLFPGDLANLHPEGRNALADSARFRRRPDLEAGGAQVWQRVNRP